MDDVAKLRAAVQDLQERLSEETELRSDLESRCHLLEKLAHRDPTSGLRTETYLRSRVQEEIERSIRYPSATTLVTLCAPREREDNLSKLGIRLRNELRSCDHLFGLTKGGIAILLVETPEEGARTVMNRIAADLEQFISGYGYSVTSFPVDTNLADEFLKLALERHNGVVTRLHPDMQDAAPSTN
jgi:GGDEF domain-containing protein